MDYRQLHAFVVLAEELHFGRAAHRLNITQPALTQQIKSFEERLKLALFIRDRRHVSLTAEGRFLLDEARSIFGHCAAFFDDADNLRQGGRGLLKIGYVGSAILDPAMIMLIKNYRANKPETTLKIEQRNVNELLNMMLGETLDLAFVRSPVPKYESMEYLDIATRPLIAVLPHQHKLSGERKISLASLSSEPFFIQQDPHGVGLGWSSLSACHQAGFIPKNIQFTQDVAAAIGLVSMAMGVTLVPETQSSVLVSDVSYCALEERFATTTLTLCWRKEMKHRLLRDFIDDARALTCRR